MSSTFSCRFPSFIRACMLGAAASLILPFSGCSSPTPLAAVPRAAGVATVRIEPRVAVPESFSYQGNVAAAARGAQAAGIIGVLPAEIIAAFSNSSGRRRFEPVFRRASATLPGVVRTAFQDELVLAHYFRVFTPETRTTDGTFRLTILSAGLDAAAGPGNVKPGPFTPGRDVIRSRANAGLAPTLTVRAELVKSDGSVVWQREARGVGGGQPLASYEAAPELFARGIEEAADDVARKLVREPAPDSR